LQKLGLAGFVSKFVFREKGAGCYPRFRNPETLEVFGARINGIRMLDTAGDLRRIGVDISA
jgi:hypothetical protein